MLDNLGFVEGRKIWFQGGSALDELLRRDFMADHERVVFGVFNR